MIHYGEVTGRLMDGAVRGKSLWIGREGRRGDTFTKWPRRAPTWLRRREDVSTNGKTFVNRHWGCNDVCGVIEP